MYGLNNVVEEKGGSWCDQDDNERTHNLQSQGQSNAVRVTQCDVQSYVYIYIYMECMYMIERMGCVYDDTL